MVLSCSCSHVPRPTVDAIFPALTVTCWEFPRESILLSHLLTRALEGFVFSVVSELGHRTAEPGKASMSCQQTPSLELCPRFSFGVTFCDLEASCIPGDYCKSKVVDHRPVPWRLEHSGARSERHEHLESGCIKGAEALFSLSQSFSTQQRASMSQTTAAFFQRQC